MRFVVVGGGIAGICCTEELCRLAAKPTDEVVLVSASSTLKVCNDFSMCGAKQHQKLRAEKVHAIATQGVDQVVKITRNIEEFKGMPFLCRRLPLAVYRFHVA